MKLLTSQKNALFKLIENHQHLSPNQFELIEDYPGGYPRTLIGFKKSEFCFKISDSDEYYGVLFANYIPGKDKYNEATNRLHWDGIIEHFQDWLDNVQKENSQPDLWNQLKTEIIAIGLNVHIDNAKFTAWEFEELSQRMSILAENISSLPLLLEQQEEIKRELARITKTAKDLGKFDWANLLIGTLISVVAQLAVTKENVIALWDIVKNTLKGYLLK